MLDGPNGNCRGCGAALTRHVCGYCGRKTGPGDKVTPDPKDDPKRNAEIRKELT